MLDTYQRGFNRMRDEPNTIRRLVIAMGEAFRQKISEATINAYLIGLGDLSEDQLQRAGGAALQRCKFMPSPAELREFAGIKTETDRAFAAWGEVLEAVPLGPYKHISFEDGIINATIRNLGGWPNVLDRLGGADGEKWMRQEFCKAYASFERSGVDGDACRPLQGLSEASVVNGEVVQPRIVQVGKGGQRRIMAPQERAERPRILQELNS